MLEVTILSSDCASEARAKQPKKGKLMVKPEPKEQAFLGCYITIFILGIMSLLGRNFFAGLVLTILFLIGWKALMSVIGKTGKPEGGDG